jgi:hypothetical protein
MPPARNHQMISFYKTIDLNHYVIDKNPVTNAEFYQFIKATRYQPDDSSNFLVHWIQGKPPDSLLDQPVVYVNLEDAKAFATWKGKRLPLEEEWQIARQTRSIQDTPTNLRSGNFREMTQSFYSDGYTEFIILKGGSDFKAEGSDWYVRGGPQPDDVSTKYILYWPGLDRSSTISFRCAADIP